MGAASNIAREELDKPADASDVDTPRKQSAKAEVARLRALLLNNYQSALHQLLTFATGSPRAEGKDAADDAAEEATEKEGLRRYDDKIDAVAALDDSGDGKWDGGDDEFASESKGGENEGADDGGRRDAKGEGRGHSGAAATPNEDSTDAEAVRVYLASAHSMDDGMDALDREMAGEMELAEWDEMAAGRLAAAPPSDGPECDGDDDDDWDMDDDERAQESKVPANRGGARAGQTEVVVSS